MAIRRARKSPRAMIGGAILRHAHALRTGAHGRLDATAETQLLFRRSRSRRTRLAGRARATCWRPTPSAPRRTFSEQTSSASSSWSPGPIRSAGGTERCSACETTAGVPLPRAHTKLQRATARAERPRARSPARVAQEGGPTRHILRSSRHRRRRSRSGSPCWRERSNYSKTVFDGKARPKNAQCATLVVRALRPIMPKKKSVKPHAVRRSLRARMTGSLDPTRHTDEEDNARGGEPFQSSCAQGHSLHNWRTSNPCRLGPLWQAAGWTRACADGT